MLTWISHYKYFPLHFFFHLIMWTSFHIIGYEALFFFLPFVFLGLYPWHMEVPRLEVETKL